MDNMNAIHSILFIPKLLTLHTSRSDQDRSYPCRTAAGSEPKGLPSRWPDGRPGAFGAIYARSSSSALESPGGR